MQQQCDVESDGKQQAVEYAEHEHAEYRGERRQVSASPDEILAELVDAQRMTDCVDDDCREHRAWRALDPRQEQHEHDEHGQRRTQAGQARLRTRCFIRRCRRIAGADGRALQQAGSDIGHAERDEVAIRSHFLIVLERECADRTVRFRVENKHQREREFAQAQQLPGGRPREFGPVQSQLDRTNRFHRMRGQPWRCRDAGDNHQQRTRQLAQALERK